MTKTPKAYRHDLAEDLLLERKDAREKIKEIQDNPDLFAPYKEEAIKKIKEMLYQKLQYVNNTPEYHDAKNKKQDLNLQKQAVRGKRQDVIKMEEIVTKQKKLLTEKEAKLAQMNEEYGETKESKEIATKSLEFEEDTFKIDSKGWKEEVREVFNQKKPLKVKVNATGDVVEYLHGPAKGEQIFIGYDAFLRELCNAKNCSPREAEAKYLMTPEEFEQKMADKPSYSDEYKRFFHKELGLHLAGRCHPENDNNFFNVGSRSNVWLAGGHNVVFMKNQWGLRRGRRDLGCSGRLLKN